MLDIALEIAKANPVKALPPMAAILADSKGRVVAVGMNSRKSHPLQKKYGRDYYSIILHAEIDAIRRALRTKTKEEIAELSIYIARAGKDGLPRLAKPCKGCQRALEDFGIKEVQYTKD